jgi:F-type H+-transporting ATPase subunit f
VTSLNFSALTMMGLGELPKEYSSKVHGPYDPAIFYGKKDSPLAQTKLGELPAWMSRRSMNPVAMGRAISRGWWRYQHKYIFPKYCGLTPVVHYIVGISTLFYCLNYKKYSHHRNKKYHW